jgi:cysteine-rich repeat protein
VTSVKADGDAGEGDVTVTIEPAGVGRIAVEGTAPTEQSARGALSEGIATFTFACDVTGSARDAKATIKAEGATEKAETTVTCKPQVIQRTIAASIIDCQRRLQADGNSSCVVDVTVRDANNLPATGVELTAVVAEVTPVGGGAGDTRVLRRQGTTDGALSERLEDLATDDTGTARFVVASPTFRLEQTMKIKISDNAGNTVSTDITIAPFEDKSRVIINAAPTSISSGGSTQVTVTGRALNGDLAVGGEATITVATGLTPTLGGCLAEQAGALVATLTDGSCTFTVTAGDVGTTAQTAQVTATFLANPRVAARTAAVTITINPAGVTIATVTLDPAQIFADAQPASTTLTVNLSLDGAPLPGSVVTVTVASESRGVIKLTTQRVGNGAPVAVANEDTATVTAGADGVVSFTIAADNPLSRGNGRVTIGVRDPDGDAFDVVDPATVTVTVDRAPLLSSVVFERFEPDNGIIGVPGGPLQSSASVHFTLFDEQNAPVANVPVRFVAQSSVPGVAIVPFGTSDAFGKVNTVVTAGRVAGPITVVAIVDSPALAAVSRPISVVGGLPNSAYSSIVCDTVAAQDPSTDCTVVLADKFTNLVTTDLNVQFRAEGGSITPSAKASGGTATASFLAGPPGAGSADVRNWSYSPLRTPPTSVVNAFAGCFDRTTRTPCDLVALCGSGDPAAQAFCPLPPSQTGDPAGCVADIDPLALAALAAERANPGDWEFALFTGRDVGGLVGAEVRAQFDAYLDSQRACGITLGCIVGDVDGLGLDESDDCPVNPGCLDFSGDTECPQDGLLDILAAVRGEEGFDDENGNGVRDAGESFVDFPEPFLDKNSSCSYDSLNDNPRLTASQKVRLSDLFIDSDSTDGRFGFNIGGDRQETNGVFDTDTEIFLKTSVVQLGNAKLQFGAEVDPADCGVDGRTRVACPEEAQAATGRTSLCTETARDDAILEDCIPGGGNFRDGDIATYVFRWTDGNGNCPSNDFGGEPSVTAEGPVELAFNDTAYSPAECGAVPGAAGSKNLERPWCEEHPDMGAPTREIAIIAKCDGETGDQVVTLRFELDGASAVRTLRISCPVCGDNRREGNEQCDDGNRRVGDGCDADCAVEAP